VSLAQLVSEVKVRNRLIAGTEDSSPAEGMDILVIFVCCVYSGICDRLITRSQESYRARARVCVFVRARARVCVCVCVCDLKPQNEKD